MYSYFLSGKWNISRAAYRLDGLIYHYLPNYVLETEATWQFYCDNRAIHIVKRIIRHLKSMNNGQLTEYAEAFFDSFPPEIALLLQENPNVCELPSGMYIDETVSHNMLTQ